MGRRGPPSRPAARARPRGRQPFLELADLQEVRRRDGGRDQDAQASDPVFEADAVGDDDVEEPPDAGYRVEPRQVEGDRDRALLAPAEATQTAGLGGVLGPLGVVAEAEGAVAQGRHLARMAIGPGSDAAALD